MAYLDEGQGPPIVFVHGTPGWSFEWRAQIQALQAAYRCIAPDFVGFGLSDKPPAYPYTLAQHTENLRSLLEALNIGPAHWVISDFGGPIAGPLMLEAPDQVLSVTAMNTWLWRWDQAKPGAEKQLARANNGLMRFLYRRLNFEIRVMLRWAWGKSAPLDRSRLRHYSAPFRAIAHREGLVGFLRAIAEGHDHYQALWQQRSRLAAVPALLIWGGQDPLVTDEHFGCLKSFFPAHQTLYLARTGHFPQDEAAERVTHALQEFLQDLNGKTQEAISKGEEQH
jgi:haloalkane dehalogenase